MRHRSDGERGQVIIVAALVIAAVFVGLALVLNSGIYAENLSSRETTDAGDALTFSSGADRAVAEAYERTNAAEEATADDARATFNGTVDDWADARRRRAARRGTVAELDRTPHVGWRLEQDADREYTPAGESGTESWTVVDETGRVGAFRLNVTRDSLYDATVALNDTSDEAFRFNVTNGSHEWEAYLFRESINDRFVVHVGNPDNKYADVDELIGGGSACAINADRAIVNVRNQTLDDGGTSVDCPQLAFDDDLEGEVNVSYGNVHVGGDSRIIGQYTLVVNGSDAVETDAAGAPTEFNASDGSPPTAQAVVYSASYATDYRRSDLRHVRDVRYMVREESYRAD